MGADQALEPSHLEGHRESAFPPVARNRQRSVGQRTTAKMVESLHMTATLLSASEYLRTEFRPDADFVDGHVEERNGGEKSHGKMQVRLVLLLREIGLFAALETRLKVTSTRYRVPDVCAYHAEPEEEVFTTPPYICIEVLSPEDRIARTMEVAQDYFQIGVLNVWLVDPVGRMIYVCDAAGGWSAVTDANVRTSDGRLVLTVSQILG